MNLIEKGGLLWLTDWYTEGGWRLRQAVVWTKLHPEVKTVGFALDSGGFDTVEEGEQHEQQELMKAMGVPND